MENVTINDDAILAVYVTQLKRTNRLIDQHEQLILSHLKLRDMLMQSRVELEELRAERVRLYEDIQREFPDVTAEQLDALV